MTIEKTIKDKTKLHLLEVGTRPSSGQNLRGCKKFFYGQFLGVNCFILQLDRSSFGFSVGVTVPWFVSEGNSVHLKRVSMFS